MWGKGSIKFDRIQKEHVHEKSQISMIYAQNCVFYFNENKMQCSLMCS